MRNPVTRWYPTQPSPLLTKQMERGAFALKPLILHSRHKLNLYNMISHDAAYREWIEFFLEREIMQPLVYTDGPSVYFGGKNIMAYAEMCLVANELGRSDHPLELLRCSSCRCGVLTSIFLVEIRWYVATGTTAMPP